MPGARYRRSVASWPARSAGAVRGSSRWLRGAICMAAIGLLLGPLPAVAQTGGGELPSPARPGAVVPGLDDRRRTPPEPADPVLEIPPMIDRPLDPDAGERVLVLRFDVTGAQDRPRHGIRVEAIEERLADALAERPEGFTIGQLMQVADRITNYYRERGLILSQAVVPEQTVEDGIVTIQVIEGRLGAVRPEGNERYSDEALQAAFSGLVGEPVSQGEAEAALLTLTDYPGLAAFGVFEPGREVGTADMVLQVRAEERFEGQVRLDTHGTEETGRARARAVLQWNNPTGNADRITLAALHSLEPANTLFGSLEYQRFLGRHYRAGAFVRSNRFDVGGDLADFDISGETDQGGLYLTRQWTRSREFNATSRLELAAKRSRTLREGDQDNEDRLTVLSLDLEFDSVDPRFGGLNFGGIEVSQGFNDLLGAMGSAGDAEDRSPSDRPSRSGASGFAPGQFTRLFGYYSRLQNITGGQSLLLRTEAQWSPDLLVPMEQYAIGGADNVRAFPTSHVLLDSAWFASAEYIVEVPWPTGTAFGDHAWSDILSATVFYDYGGGELNDPRGDQTGSVVDFHGVGAGLNLDVPALLNSRIQVAWAIDGDDRLADPDAVNEPQFWFDIRYDF